MTSVIVPEVNLIVQQLHKVADEKLIKFMLITQCKSPSNEYSFHFSNHFTESQINDIKVILGRSPSNIRPLLNRLKTIALRKTQQPNNNNNNNNQDDDIVGQLRDLFNSLNQNVCKDIAKSWIKILEPNKQKHFPYTKKDTKPPWWPSNVVHTEPDHLKKDDRIQVLINVVRNPKFSLESVNVDSIRHKLEHTEGIIHEILYICYYDRLVQDAVSKDEKLISQNEKLLLDGDETDLIVSNMRYHDDDGILQSRIDNTEINNNVFKLGGSLIPSTRKSTPQHASPKSKSKFKVRKSKIKKRFGTPVMTSLKTGLQIASHELVIQPREGTSQSINIRLNPHDSGNDDDNDNNDNNYGDSNSSLTTTSDNPEDSEFAMMFQESHENLQNFLSSQYHHDEVMHSTNLIDHTNILDQDSFIHHMNLVVQGQHEQYLKDDDPGDTTESKEDQY